ncbi:hypothetical protein RSM18_004939 [Serratia marcescens]|nr:hypothetical protein [Serratia marcescens]ELI8846720.1 hypothetical protein [Serratia marcescens]
MNFKETYDFLIKSFDDVRGTIPNWVENTPWESAWPMLDYENPDVKVFLEQLDDELASADPFFRVELSFTSLDPRLNRKNSDGWLSAFGSFYKQLESALRERQKGIYLRNVNDCESLKALFKAVSHVEAARGMCMTLSQTITMGLSDWYRTQGAIKGGIAKAALNIPVKEQAIKLLYENAPTKGGWGNRSMAVKAIVDELWQFIEDQNHLGKRIDLSHENLVTTLKQWAYKDELLREAFNNTVRTKKKK